MGDDQTLPGRPRRPDAPRSVQLRSGRHGLSRDTVVSNQRRRMFSAVAYVVATRGYGDTSIQRIADRAGISRRTFYEQFASKEEVYLQAFDAAVRQLLAGLDEELAAGGDIDDRLRRSLDIVLQQVAADPHRSHAFLVDVFVVGGAALEHRQSHARDFAARLGGLAEEGNGAPLPPFAAEGLVAAITDALYRRIADGRVDELPELLDDLVSFCLMFIRQPSGEL